jgi:hypothetical protein
VASALARRRSEHVEIDAIPDFSGEPLSSPSSAACASG